MRLKRLEYRGYDSAGVATLEGGHLDAPPRRRASSGTSRKSSTAQPLSGRSGIGHTRWATHGAPTETNAHPHATERLALVHNGIIENFRELKSELQDGRRRLRDRDRHRGDRPPRHRATWQAGMSPPKAVAAALKRLEGAFALAILFEGEDDLMIGARRGSPLAIGYGDGEMFFGSDAIALAPVHRPHHLSRGRRLGGAHPRRRDDLRRSRQSGEAADGEDAGHQLPRRQGQPPPFHGEGDLRAARGGRPHARPLSRLRHRPGGAARRLRRSTSPSSTGCRSPPAAPPTMPGLVAKYWFERFARLPVDIDIASEFRYREQPLVAEGPVDRRLAVGRDRRHARLAPLCQERGAEGRRDRQRAGIDHRARGRFRAADARRSGDRRRLDQGVHLPARGARFARRRGRAGARRALADGRGEAGARALARCRAS